MAPRMDQRKWPKVLGSWYQLECFCSNLFHISLNCDTSPSYRCYAQRYAQHVSHSSQRLLSTVMDSSEVQPSPRTWQINQRSRQRKRMRPATTLKTRKPENHPVPKTGDLWRPVWCLMSSPCLPPFFWQISSLRNVAPALQKKSQDPMTALKQPSSSEDQIVDGHFLNQTVETSLWRPHSQRVTEQCVCLFLNKHFVSWFFRTVALDLETGLRNELLNTRFGRASTHN